MPADENTHGRRPPAEPRLKRHIVGCEGRYKEDVMKATWQGQVLAESDDIVTVEGNAYFPRGSVRDDLLRPSSRTSVCPWKGTASYYSLEVNGQVNADAAWYYPAPKSAASQIKDRVAFWKGVQVSA